MNSCQFGWHDPADTGWNSPTLSGVGGLEMLGVRAYATDKRGVRIPAGERTRNGHCGSKDHRDFRFIHLSMNKNPKTRDLHGVYNL